MNVAQDTEGVRGAALELMVISLKEEDTERQLHSLLAQGAPPEMLAKVIPVRHFSEAYYHFATYLIWLQGMIASGVEVSLMADEAEGLRALTVARQEFEQNHPACPRCETRQYSKHAISCRKCNMDFRKRN